MLVETRGRSLTAEERGLGAFLFFAFAAEDFGLCICTDRGIRCVSDACCSIRLVDELQGQNVWVVAAANLVLATGLLGHCWSAGKCNREELMSTACLGLRH